MCIVIDELTKRYKDVTAINNLSIKIENKKSTVVCGASGSGKTTLLRLIAGLEIPDEGIIYLNKEKVSTKKYIVEPHKRNIGFVFQNPSLWPHMTVKQNILYGLNKYKKKEANQIVEELLERMDIKKIINRYPDQISGGEARRVSLARTIAPKPSIILMDEPLTNLNKELKNKMISYIKDIIEKRNTTLIYVTHDEDECVKIADKIVKMEEGKIKNIINNN